MYLPKRRIRNSFILLRIFHASNTEIMNHQQNNSKEKRESHRNPVFKARYKSLGPIYQDLSLNWSTYCKYLISKYNICLFFSIRISRYLAIIISSYGNRGSNNKVWFTTVPLVPRLVPSFLDFRRPLFNLAFPT